MRVKTNRQKEFFENGKKRAVSLGNIKKNVLYQSVYEVLIILMPLVTSPYIARVLGAERIGIYSYTYSIAYYFMMFAMLGIRNYGNRMIAGVRDDREKLNRSFSSIFVLHAILSVPALIGYAVFCIFFSGEHQVYAWIQIFWVLGALFEINWFFNGIEQFKITVTRSSIIKLATVACVFIFVRDRDDLWIYVGIMAGGNFISQSAVWFFLKRFVRFVKPTWQEIRQHVKPMLLLFIPVIAVSLYKFMAKILLGVMCSESQVGFFENADKAIGIPANIIVAFGMVMMPRISNLITKGDNRSIARYMNISMEFVMCLAVGMSMGMCAVGQRFSDLMWGAEFVYCGNLIRILSFCTIFMAFANILRTQYIIPHRMDYVYVLSVCLGAAVNLVVNLLLIPRLEATGAAIGTVCAEATVAVVQTAFLTKKLPIGQYMRKSGIFLAMGVIMYWCIEKMDAFFVRDSVALIAEIVLGIAVYGTLCLGYFIWTKNELVHKAYAEIRRRMMKR